MAYSFSYAIFRYVKDSQRDITVPVGVALWSQDAQWANARFAGEDEKVSRISKTEDRPFINLVIRKITAWIKDGELPYSDRQMSKFSDEWWNHLRHLLVHKIRVSEPLSIDCHDPEAELEPLFASLVQPDDEEPNDRIDTLVRNSLAEIANRFRRGSVAGFAGKPVPVMRVFHGRQADVVIDAVNLSTTSATKEADALVSKLLRARRNGHGMIPKDRAVIALIGYVSSPGGLNGEHFLKDWIEQAGEAKTFDLIREKSFLKDAAQAAMKEAEPEEFELS